MLVVVTILLLVASWVYPPGFHYRDHSHGWFFLFDTRSVMRVDFGRLILLDAIVVTIGGGFAWAVSRNSPFRNTVIRLAFYSLVAVPVIALIWGSAFLIQDANRRAEERTAGQAAKVAREHAKATERASKVELGALKQISLFDVQCWGTKLDPSVVIRINGRVRNGLPRAVEKFVLKASFYNAYKQEIRNLALHNVTVLSGGQSGFDEDVSIHNLPIGWTYTLEVSEAHYVQ